MASIIIADDTKSYDGTWLETRSLGGTESSVIRFARAMARRGHDVCAYTNCAAPILDGGVRWFPLTHARPETCDLYVACQHPRLFGLVPRPKRLIGWMLWQPNEWKHYKKILKVWWHQPVPILTSLHQARIYSAFLPRRNPHIVIPLGLPDDIRGLTPLASPPGPQAIFCSNPQRNLNALVRIWCERVHPRCPEAILNLYGITDLQPGDDAWQIWQGTLLPANISPAAKASVRIHVAASRADLNAALRGSRVMLYLGHKVEAFCLAVAEAQAMGVPAVVAPLTVLPERVDDGVTGYVREDLEEFANATIALLTDDAQWRRQHEAALKLKQGISWDEFAARFECAVLSDFIATDRSWHDLSRNILCGNSSEK
jgi:glycosyltransferase involved in cell wall biosynthesis